MNYHNPMNSVELSRIRAISEKAAELQNKGNSIIKLQIGEPDFTTPPNILGAAKTALDKGYTHYAPNRGIMPLRIEISKKLYSENNLDMNPETEILVTSGCAEALFCSFVGILNPDDEVIIIEPAYVSYLQLARIAHAKPVLVHAKEEKGWLPDSEDIEAAVTDKTRMIVINSPCNPTGAVFTLEVLEAIASIAIKHDLIVLSDEVYEKLIYDNAKHISIASLEGMRDRTITINGFSKAFAMTGWRIGYMTACKELLIPALKVHQYAIACSNSISEYAAIEALKNSELYVNEMIAEYVKRRSVLLKAFKETDEIYCPEPKGAFYIYPNISKSRLTGTKFAEGLLNTFHVACVPGMSFDSFCDNNIRISYASSLESLKEAIVKINLLLKQCK